MQLYRVLIVDDESYIVNAVAALLECQNQWDMDVYHAYSAEEALRTLNHMRIDILITDIRMSGMTGLELAGYVRKIWPECRTLLLTAYDEFSLAYEAFSLGVAGFLLKTESDERLLEEIGKAVTQLEHARAQNAVRLLPSASQGGLNAELFISLLCIKRAQPQVCALMRMLGVMDYPCALWLIAVSPEDGDAHIGQLEGIIRGEVATRAHAIVACEHQRMLFMLMRPNAPASSLIGALELAQERYAQAFSADAACVISTLSTGVWDVNAQYQRILRFLGTGHADLCAFIHLLPEKEPDIPYAGDALFAVLLDYIAAHLQDDLSLNTLSMVVGYSPSYLSKLFQKKAGQRISMYIAQQKLNRLQALMRDTSLSIGEIADRMGFASRSYFNRYIKRLTGQTPQQLRAAIADEQTP